MSAYFLRCKVRVVLFCAFSLGSMCLSSAHLPFCESRTQLFSVLQWKGFCTRYKKVKYSLTSIDFHSLKMKIKHMYTHSSLLLTVRIAVSSDPDKCSEKLRDHPPPPIPIPLSLSHLQEMPHHQDSNIKGIFTGRNLTEAFLSQRPKRTSKSESFQHCFSPTNPEIHV